MDGKPTRQTPTTSDLQLNAANIRQFRMQSRSSTNNPIVRWMPFKTDAGSWAYIDGPTSEHVTQISNKHALSTEKKVAKPEDTLPTPRLSTDDHNVSRNRLRREELLGNARKIVSDPLNKAGSLDDVSSKDFQWLKAKGEAGEIPGWESFRLASKYLKGIILDSTKSNIELTTPTASLSLNAQLGNTNPSLMLSLKLYDNSITRGSDTEVHLIWPY